MSKDNLSAETEVYVVYINMTIFVDHIQCKKWIIVVLKQDWKIWE